jgi:hypothetical protein
MFINLTRDSKKATSTDGRVTFEWSSPTDPYQELDEMNSMPSASNPNIPPTAQYPGVYFEPIPANILETNRTAPAAQTDNTTVGNALWLSPPDYSDTEQPDRNKHNDAAPTLKTSRDGRF